jgi:hypothetical protein
MQAAHMDFCSAALYHLHWRCRPCIGSSSLGCDSRTRYCQTSCHCHSPHSTLRFVRRSLQMLLFLSQAFIWAAGLQMLLTGSRLSLPAGAAGLLAGTLYQLYPLGLRNFRVSSSCCVVQACPRQHRPALTCRTGRPCAECLVQLPRWACGLLGAQTPTQPVVRHAGPPGGPGAQHPGQQPLGPQAVHHQQVRHDQAPQMARCCHRRNLLFALVT